MGKFIPTLSQVTEPIRQLAKREPFVVDKEFQEAFVNAKQGIASYLHRLAYFQPSSTVPTAISSDASPRGLGAMLWQREERGQWTPVSCASRSLTDIETQYSKLEREMLGVVFAITRFRQYVLGRTVEVFTDHKPFLSIIPKPFDEVSPRLQRWLVSLMPYQITLTHVAGHQSGFVL